MDVLRTRSRSAPGGDQPEDRRRAAASSLGLWLGLCGALGAMAASPPAPEPGGGRDLDHPPDIFLVTIDTLRADHLGAYGHPLATTPFIDKLSRGARVYERCYSTSSWTAPALASIMTSLLPSRHGIVQGLAKDGGVIAQPVLPAAAVSFPELLQQAGYRTLGATANGHLERRLGFAQGFDTYTCVGFMPTALLEPHVRAMGPALRAPGPWFLWLHYFDPHAPYKGREPWLSAFHTGARFPELEERVFGSTDSPSREEEAYLRALYQSEIRHVDQHLAMLVKRFPRMADAVIVLASDHGEELFDHGMLGHGHNLYDETVRVPLLVRGSPGRRGVDPEPVSLLDLAPTIVRLAGLKAVGMSGRDLEEPIREADRRIIAELSRGTELRSVVAGQWKATYARRDRLGSLYNTDDDPGDRASVVRERADVFRLLRKSLDLALARERAARLAPEASEAPEGTREQLESLGYVD